jgi:sRNA-binding protein
MPNSSIYALQALKGILLENERVKDELHQVIHSALRNYYELSKYQHKMLAGNERAQLEGKINTKIDESMAELKDI